MCNEKVTRFHNFDFENLKTFKFKIGIIKFVEKIVMQEAIIFSNWKISLIFKIFNKMLWLKILWL